ncbi:cystathionine gamma-synthase [Candidatus Bathyarchaeota archaeon]|nr:MAG: cystathionine gamma-synthase [Crenarchaeota archaeon 13_1_40CM_3_53_5]TMI27079.1 MAG: cystathionine gamma-synthase [Candidatus Bathyarchaeota archaeon]TMI30772.1 MAG: cystathionine gamma-synthase [Candidatus Bathyarchaeota archaeon]
MRFSTKAIHAGQEADPATGSVTVPVYLTSTYLQHEPGKEGKYVYSRTGNPTRNALERSLAALEGGKFGLAFSSGMAATTTILLLLQKGDHVITGDDVYGGVYRLFNQILRNYGLEFTYVDPRNPENVKKALRKNTRMVWVETPTNPLMKIADVRAIAKIAKSARAITVVDNTFMSPYFQNPLRHGADIVVHSTTKYLGGHSDLIGGAAITSDPALYKRLKFLQNAVGAIPGPLDCWLVLRGVKTLALRMERHDQNARKIVDYLLKQPKILRVNYPGLKDHPQRDVVKRQMRGYGGMLSFELKGGLAECKKLLKKLRVFTVAESLGGVESLIEHPASMTHASVPRERRLQLGVSDGLIRVSTGVEDAEDLLEDLERAFRTS